MRGCLVLIQPYDPATGSRITIRCGASLNAATLRADGVPWLPAFSQLPKISLDFFDIDYRGTVQAGKASLTINTARLAGLTRDYLTTLVWEGSPITIYAGDGKATADLSVDFVGIVTGGVIDRTSRLLPLQCEVNRKLFDVPLLNQEFDGSGGYGGDPEVRGQLRPACFGKPVNVPVFFFDQVNWIGQVDGYGNVTAINNLFEDAADFGPKVANYATYGALLAATLAEGQWATCIAQGLIRLGADPRGAITCDPICGGGTPGAMMKRWLATHAGVSATYYDSASADALDAALTTLLGHAPAVSYYTQSQVQVLDRIQAMCAACNATPLIAPNGKMTFSRAISIAAAALTLDRIGGRNPAVTDWRSLDQPEPWWRLKAEAAKTWRVHSLNEIDYEDDLKDMGDYDPAETYRQGMIVYNNDDGRRYIWINPTPGSVFPPNATFWDLYQVAVDASVVRYLDGTPVEDLQPAQDGADVTGLNAAVGDGNRVRFSEMERGTQGWWKRADASGNGVLTSALNNGKRYIRLAGSFTAASQTAVISNDWSNVTSRSYFIPVNANKRVYIGAELRVVTAPSGSCPWSLQAAFLDSAGSVVAGSAVILASGTGTIATETLFGDFVTAPSTACYVFFDFRMDNGATGTGAYDFLMYRPMVCGAGANQTVPPAFTPGPSNEVAADTTKAVPAPNESLSFTYNSITGAAIDLSGGTTRDILFRLKDSLGGTITSGVTWTYKVVSGTVNGFTTASAAQTMSVSGGVGTLNVASLGSDVVAIQVTASYNSAQYPWSGQLVKNFVSGSSGGGGGATVLFDQTVFPTNPITLTTTFQDITGYSAAAAAAAINAILNITPSGTGTGSWTVELRVMKNVSGTPTQVGVTQNSGSDKLAGEPAGAAVFNYNLTGLTGTFQYRLEARVTASTRAHSISGHFNGTS